MTLEISECYMGYPRSQVERVVGPERIKEFDRWMYGQTAAICQGENCQVSHGTVIYPWDVKRFLEGRPIID